MTAEIEGDTPRAAEAPVDPYRLAAWVYARALGLILLFAFLSIWVQVEGLFGDLGIAPVVDTLASVAASEVSVLELPTLLWLWPTATGLHAVCLVGTVAALLVVTGVLPHAGLLAGWLTYLSIVNVGYPFTSFQWDTLLIETCFVSVFFLRGPDRRDQARSVAGDVARWAMWWLIFRLMFRAGLVKLTSGDPTWANLTALTVHYETQPLPTLLGWYAHQLPDWIHSVSCVVMFSIELVLPFGIFLPGRLGLWCRRLAAAGFTVLMMLIIATGNYGFFNWLAIALCIPLLDDALLSRVLPRKLVHAVLGDSSTPSGSTTLTERKRPLVLAVGPALVLLMSGIVFVGAMFHARPLSAISGFRTFNNYGLFAVMTVDRPEIVIEGSVDGQTWHAYGFRYKPGRLGRAPWFNTPHQPRLDWHMWFAALGTHRQHPWLARFMDRLLEGEPVVLSLLSHDPFRGSPPRFVRAIVYDYRFTDFETRARTGQWWTRGEPSLYAPVRQRAQEPPLSRLREPYPIDMLP